MIDPAEFDGSRLELGHENLSSPTPADVHSALETGPIGRGHPSGVDFTACLGGGCHCWRNQRWAKGIFQERAILGLHLEFYVSA
ncbi:hypothetical protein HDF16_003726 [Granulicella aggregans]|uniref:Uncharacterized protein n=1 Tax=Granulicella aggregans TaxID=474949 RepID=A0A7W7ZFM6_9BACT|nr:hypothetical protein [Granulicella aggregans]